MREDAIRILSSGIVGTAIMVAYLVFLARCIAVSDWNNLSSLEELVLGTQILRLVFVLALSRPPRMQPLFALILFSFEVFLIPIFAVFAYWTGDAGYTNLMGKLLTTWIGVSALVLSPYAIFEFVKGVVNGTSLVNTVTVSTLELGGLVLLSNTLATAQTRLSGPSSLGALFIENTRSQSPFVFSGLGSSLLLEAGLILFFLGMIVHLSVRDNRISSPILISHALLVPLLGATIALSWATSLLSISSNTILVFTIPALVGALTLWGVSRAK